MSSGDFLDPQQVLKIHFRRFNFSVSCHVGPTGALRIPLCQFSKTQLAHLSELHDQLMKSTNEFEVLKTETPEQSGPKEHHGIPETETPAVNHAGVEPQEIAGEGGGEPGCNSSLASNAGQGLRRPVPGQQPRDPSTLTSSRRTSNRHRELRLPNNKDIEKGNISGSHGRVRGDLYAERTDKHDKAITSTESGKFSGGPGPGDGHDPAAGGTTCHVRPPDDDEALHLSKAGSKLQAPVLALPDEPRPTMLDVCLVSDPAAPTWTTTSRRT